MPHASRLLRVLSYQFDAAEQNMVAARYGNLRYTNNTTISFAFRYCRNAYTRKKTCKKY